MNKSGNASIESINRAATRLNVLPVAASRIANRDVEACNDLVQLLTTAFEAAEPESCCKPLDTAENHGWHMPCEHLRRLWVARDYQMLARINAPVDRAFPCSCNGRGTVSFGGGTINGVFTGKTGTCFRCSGKGWQDAADVKRNKYYDNHVRKIYQ